ncbi:hypothetical protein NAI57_11895, partial [Francisella tularensis subsp. holarctica]|nr:hypothetical protein [Francisella tularensis subsp. holarctica]
LICALPLTYYSQKILSHIVLFTDNCGITVVFTHNLGRFFGLTCVVLYFVAIFLNMPMYCIGLNREVSTCGLHLYGV